ncbi:MAG: N-acetylmuramoyl-L-alanine amidase [Planctomycetaceae bacterium]|nr:N-acetylmuramoyl-L-alanine amidase [Planctomycetaceae bacterium]
MALKFMARIALRPRRPWLIAIVAQALLATAGCSHHRESLRPVYSVPAAAAAPCTNCGPGAGSSAIVTEPAAGASTGAAPRVLPSEPATGEPAGSTESTVPSLGSPAGSARSSQRNVLPERAPKAVIGDEPDTDMIPSQSTRPRGSQVPPSPAPAKPPVLQGPGSSTPSSMNTTDGVRTTSASRPVRQASAQQRLNPYFGESGGNELFYPSKADRPWKYIVLHHSANSTGNYDQIDHEHRKVLGYDGCGYHFVIGNGTGSQDGQIEVAQRWVNQKHGVHCRNAKNAELDEYGIGICFVGDLDKEPPTPRQVAAAKALIAYLSSRYGIARSHVETHAHIAATPTVCPGRHFPIEAIVAAKPGARDDEATARRAVPTSWRVARRPGLEVY